MPAADLVKDGARQMMICNACRYCEGYCAVFPAMELRRNFTKADLTYLANLCFDCRDCYYACQYAPPHEFAINIPKLMAQVRNWGITIALIFAVIVAVLMLVPSLFGFDRYVIESGSMEGAIDKGSVVYAKPAHVSELAVAVSLIAHTPTGLANASLSASCIS